MQDGKPNPAFLPGQARARSNFVSGVVAFPDERARSARPRCGFGLIFLLVPMQFAFCFGFYLARRGAWQSARRALWLIGWLLLASCAAPSIGRAQVAAGAPKNAAPGVVASAATGAAPAAAVASAPVGIGGRELFQVTGADQAEALMRADLINGRLQRLIERSSSVPRWTPADLQTRNGAPTIILGGEEILSITPTDAAANGVPVPQLAQQWGNVLSSAVRATRVTRDGPFSGIAVTISASITELGLSIAAWLPRLLSALLLALLFWLVARGVRSLANRATHNPDFDPNLRQLVLALAFYGVWALGFLAILSALGVDSSSIAATVGVSGFVLGFAFKDVLSHFFAGLMLLSSRQLTIGGQIAVNQFEGTVEGIDLRATRLRLFDGRLVTIPNGDVFNSAVISNTANPTRRHEFRVAIGLQDDARAAIALALDTVKNVDGVLNEPAPNVVASDLSAPAGFGVSSVELRVLFHVASSNPRYFDILSECILRVKAEFERAKITMPSKSPATE